MNLVLDIGNTNVKWAIFDKNEMIKFNYCKQLSTVYLEKILSKNPKINTVCIASQLGDIFEIKNLCIKYNLRYLSLQFSSKIPIENHYKSPKTLGLDRISLAVGAAKIYPGNKLIIDFGTCITYDIVLGDNYMGGQISAGIETRLDSLSSSTKNLPKLEFKNIDYMIGDTTNKGILLGVNDSIIFEVNGVIEKYKSRYPNIKTIITGGGLKMIKGKLKNINFINPYLLMEGLNYIIAFNNEK